MLINRTFAINITTNDGVPVSSVPIQVSCDGTDIYIDGKLCGTTPNQRKVVFGQIRATVPGKEIGEESLSKLKELCTSCKLVTSTTNEPGVLIEAPIEGRDDLANLKASIESIGFAFRCVDYTADADGENEVLEALLVYVGEND